MAKHYDSFEPTIAQRNAEDARRAGMDVGTWLAWKRADARWNYLQAEILRRRAAGLPDDDQDLIQESLELAYTMPSTAEPSHPGTLHSWFEEYAREGGYPVVAAGSVALADEGVTPGDEWLLYVWGLPGTPNESPYDAPQA